MINSLDTFKLTQCNLFSIFFFQTISNIQSISIQFYSLFFILFLVSGKRLYEHSYVSGEFACFVIFLSSWI